MKRASERSAAERGGARKMNKKLLLNVIVDVLLLLMAFFLIVYAVARWGNTGAMEPKETASLTCTIEIKGADERMVNAVRSHDRIFFLNEEARLGYIQYIEVLHDSATGDATLQLTVSVVAEYRPQDGYYIEGHRIAVGLSYELSVGNYFAQGLCIALQK